MNLSTRSLAESALQQLCGAIGVDYTTEGEPVDGAWFLSSVTRGRVNIEQWSEGTRTGGRGVSQPLGSYGLNLTNSEVYDRCWFAHRVLKAAQT